MFRLVTDGTKRFTEAIAYRDEEIAEDQRSVTAWEIVDYAQKWHDLYKEAGRRPQALAFSDFISALKRYAKEQGVEREG